jgi:hypothetical protein
MDGWVVSFRSKKSLQVKLVKKYGEKKGEEIGEENGEIGEENGDLSLRSR